MLTVRLEIIVQPRSHRAEVAGIVDGCVKVRVCAPPVEGKANEECIKVLSRFFDVPKSSVRVVSGSSSRKKIVQIEGIEATDVARRMGS